MFKIAEKDIEDCIREFVQELSEAARKCSDRGIEEASIWALDLSLTYKPVKSSLMLVDSDHSSCSESSPSATLTEAESDQYYYALSLFRRREYIQVLDVLKDAEHQKPSFLRLYAKYKSYTSKCEAAVFEKWENDGEIYAPFSIATTELNSLTDELSQEYDNNRLDAFGLYLYGVVLLEQHKRHKKQTVYMAKATTALLSSVRAYPYIWSAWLELASTVTNYEQYVSFQQLLQTELIDNAALNLPTRIMINLILARLCNHLELNISLYMDIIEHLRLNYFRRSPFLEGEWGKHLIVAKKFEESAKVFEKLWTSNLGRLSYMDFYANVLFQLNDKNELKKLADACSGHGENTVEANIILGNNCKLQHRHLESNWHFAKVVMMQRSNHMAWLTLGHNFLELDNPLAAIEAYTEAVALKEHDHRTYFGLGRAYESMKNRDDALEYYKKAGSLLRDDDRYSWMTLGDCFGRLGKKDMAEECYKKSY